MKFLRPRAGAVLVAALALLLSAPHHAGPAPTTPAATSTYSELKLGGRLVTYAYWRPDSNTFAVSDAYGDDQSSVVRYRLGAGKKTYSAWNTGGELSTRDRVVGAGGLPVHFRSCRADRTEKNYQCPRQWSHYRSTCRKFGTGGFQSRTGACITVRHDVLAEHPYAGWGYRLRGRLTDPTSDSSTARYQVRTHRAGESWRAPTTVASADNLRLNTFDKVIHRAGHPFFVQSRLCGTSCGAWGSEIYVGEGDPGWPVRTAATPTGASQQVERAATPTHYQAAVTPGYSVYCRYDPQLVILAPRNRGEGCFDSSGDYFAVVDTRDDGLGVAMLWRGDDKRGICRNKLGSATRPAWPTCRFESTLREGIKIKAWLATCDQTATRSCRKWTHYKKSTYSLSRRYATTHPADGG
jgi:hypothetical protein